MPAGHADQVYQQPRLAQQVVQRLVLQRQKLEDSLSLVRESDHVPAGFVIELASVPSLQCVQKDIS